MDLFDYMRENAAQKESACFQNAPDNTGGSGWTAAYHRAG